MTLADMCEMQNGIIVDIDNNCRIKRRLFDMGFIKETKNVKKSRIILASVIKMAKELNLLIITEGVETEEQVDNLTKLGCDVFQGYYFSKAIDVNEFEKRYLYRKKAG